ncbi:MAG: hypothetical protein ACTHMJ_09380 [Thermomicrobiales bacterium]
MVLTPVVGETSLVLLALVVAAFGVVVVLSTVASTALVEDVRLLVVPETSLVEDA